MEYIQDITLDLNANQAYTTVVAKQYDSGRYLRVHLTKDNIDYKFDASHAFYFRMRKPDGHGIISPATVSLNKIDSYKSADVTFDNYLDTTYFIKEDDAYQPVKTEEFFSSAEVNFNNHLTQQYYIIKDEEYQQATEDDFFTLANPQPSSSEGISAYFYKEEEEEVYKKATEYTAGINYYNWNNIDYFSWKTNIQYYVYTGEVNYKESNIMVLLTEQILAVSGRGYADIVEYDETGSVLSTVSFIVNVMSSPDVASKAISSDDFSYLSQMVLEGTKTIGEAEAWARGTVQNADIGGWKYKEDESVTNDNFNSKKANLFKKITSGGTDTYVSVENESFNNAEIYYGRSAGNNNNAKYYSEQAQAAFSSFTELAITAESSNSAGVSTVTDGNNKITGLIFKLPRGDQGAVGPTGVNTVWVSDSAPIDDDYNVWIQPNGAGSSQIILTADQVSYNSGSTYSKGRIGYAMQKVQLAMANVAADAARAGQAAGEAAAQAQIGEVSARVSVLESKNIIENPGLSGSQNFGILVIELDEEQSSESSEEQSYTIKWKDGLNYAPPAGDGQSYYIKPKSGIPIEHLDSSVKNTLNNSVTSITLNGNNIGSSDHNINLGNFLTGDNIVNKNYLDNPWFTINQHEAITDSVQAGTYICDRWKVLTNGSERTLVINSDGLSIGIAQNSDPSHTIEIGQLIDDDTWRALGGNEVTASINYRLGPNGKFQTFSWSFTCPTYNSNSSSYIDGQFNSNFSWGARIYISTIGGKKYLTFGIAGGGTLWAMEDLSDSDICIKKTKLELGSISTLDQEAAPVYNEELKKCQRYFRHYGYYDEDESNVNITLGMGIAPDSKTLNIGFTEVGDMVSIPSIIIPSYANLTAYRGFTNTTTTTNQPVAVLPSFEISGKGIGNILYVKASWSSGTTFASYYPYYLVLPSSISVTEDENTTVYNNYINFSAEP